MGAVCFACAAMAKCLLWFDPKVHNSENTNYQRTLSDLGFSLHTFVDMHAAVDFLQQQPINQQLLVLTCGSAGEEFVCLIEALDSVGAILIFTSRCDVLRHNAWATVHPKICGVRAWVEDVLELADDLAKHIMLAKVVGQRERTRALALWSSLLPSKKDVCDAPAIDQEETRLSCTIVPYGAKVERSDKYFQWCSATNTQKLQATHVRVIKQCYQDLASDQTKSHPCLVSAALMRSYTDDIGQRYPDMARALYEDVNKALRDDDAAALSAHGAYIRILRSTMKRLCKDLGMTYRSGCVYRQMTVATEVLYAYQPGFKFLWPGFVSTSKSTDGCSRFGGNVLFVIDVSQAHGITYALDLSGVSVFDDEQEVLFYPYSGFEVMERSVDHDEFCEWTVVKLRPYDTVEIDQFHGESCAGEIPLEEFRRACTE